MDAKCICRTLCKFLFSARAAQISEAELEAIARGGTLPELDEAEVGGSEASRRLLGEYETPQRCALRATLP